MNLTHGSAAPGVADGPFGVPPYYGWLMLLGILWSLYYWRRMVRRDDRFLIVYAGALLGAFVGGKVVYFLAEGFLAVGRPGFWVQVATGKTILGALLGGYAGVEITKKHLRLRAVTGDWFAWMAPVGIVIGRMGCLVHGCCLGQVCPEPGWYTLRDHAGVDRWPAVPVEITFNLVALVLLRSLRGVSGLRGQLFHLYLMGYGAFRFGHESFRDTPRLLFGVTGYQIASVAVVLLGAVAFWIRRRGTLRGTVEREAV